MNGFLKWPLIEEMGVPPVLIHLLIRIFHEINQPAMGVLPEMAIDHDPIPVFDIPLYYPPSLSPWDPHVFLSNPVAKKNARAKGRKELLGLDQTAKPR